MWRRREGLGLIGAAAALPAGRLLADTPLTLEDLGQKYGITKERTRQLEARIISRLRAYIKKDVKDFDHLHGSPGR